MMPNYKDIKPTEVIGRIVAHEMSLKDKEELHNKSSGAYNKTCSLGGGALPLESLPLGRQLAEPLPKRS